ncbi:Ig-like domain-containing protein [Alcanivorax sp.]|jgi:hypothetical protein|uniref:Ig-like domain-containing protein n=1 Tax=Alcanivorax sp. TaxID=1872427 RepID=UPI0032D943D4
MMRTSLFFAAALVLTACGGDGSKQTVDYSERNRGHVFYSYPADAQTQVSVHAPVVVQFSEARDLASEDITLTGPGGAVEVDVSEADEGRSVIVTPRQALAFNSDYTLSVSGVSLAGFSDGTLSFTTASAAKGPHTSQQLSDELVLSRRMPFGADQPFMDFSTIHLQFSQPLDRTTVDETTVSLRDSGGNRVAATLLVDGTRLTLDPQKDLTPGNEYTLQLGAALTSKTGVAYSGDSSIQLTPKDSTPRETLVLEAMATDPTKECNEGGVMLSPLSGDPINCVPLIGTLLGDATAAKLSGNVFAELGFVPNYPDAAPLRIRKGSILKGESLDVLIAGNLPASFDSGEVTVSFLSDASGYLSLAPYSTVPEAPRRVQLTLDLALSTADSRANGAFTQTLLQVELVGRAIVVDGRMVIDALGVVEPEVLGLETAYGVLSLHMESYLDQVNAPEPEVDITGPGLQSWQPGDYADRFRPGDPVVLNFDETPNQDTIIPGTTVRLTQQGAPVPFQWRLDGASLVLTPDAPLAFGTDYQVVFTDGVQDLSGNPANPQTLDFTMVDATTTSGARTPYTTTVYPGFPCAIDPGSENLANGIQGQCASAYQNDAGDLLPVPTLPANRSIEVQFSRNMDADSMRLGSACGQGSVRVEKIDTAGNCLEVVPGHLTSETRKLTITPQQPWEDGTLYRYVLASHERAGCGGDVICSQDNMPLQTAQLLGPDADEGGPNMAIAFTGAPANDNVLLPLRNLPKSDVNANFELEDTELKATEEPPGSGLYPSPTNAAKLAVTDVGGLVTAANIGCNINDTCPADKFTYLNGGIIADIAGWDEAEQALKVILYPPVLMTTNTSVYAQIAGLVSPNVPTEPLVMRGRYDEDSSGNRTLPLIGWIRYDEEEDQLMFDLTLDLLLDAPEMEAPLGLPFNLHGYPMDDLQLLGPVDFLPDGRLVISLLSTADQNIDVRIGGPVATIDLQLPAGGVNLTFQSGSIKEPQ